MLEAALGKLGYPRSRVSEVQLFQRSMKSQHSPDVKEHFETIDDNLAREGLAKMVKHCADKSHADWAGSMERARKASVRRTLARWEACGAAE